MHNCYLIFAVFVILFNEPVISSWEFAVSTKGLINFYTSDWTPVTSAAHQFDELSAITFDEIEDTLYFNDQSHLNGTIFSLKLATDGNHHVKQIIERTKKEKIQGIAFDPLERTLYWTDAANGIIYQMNLNDNHEPEIFKDNLSMPHGIAIDICRRQLYWTNLNMKESSIGRISLDQKQSKTIISGLDMPRGIVVDQFSRRIFWVDDLRGDHFAVESANLDGNDRKTIVRNMNHVPFDIAVDESNIYWTDMQENAVWKIAKNASIDDSPLRIQNFTIQNIPKGIINRNHFAASQLGANECNSVFELIKSTTLTPAPSSSPQTPTVQCLNGGHFDDQTKSCHCQLGYKGSVCEVPVCNNYCVEGTCEIASNGNPLCSCREGFTGDRCETNLCTNHCLHGGHCLIEKGEPNCQCPTSYYGNRCENMDIKEMCIRFCNKEDIDNRMGMDFEAVCNNCSGTFPSHLYYNFNGKSQSSCKESVLNKTAIFVSCGVVISLALVFFIVKTIRHVYKPLRPRIKKTYVVRKNITPTPLTCRPTTEQCEITIENCCNMNICDTPCFDPKVLQAESNKKEDKKTLINHSEDLMY